MARALPCYLLALVLTAGVALARVPAALQWVPAVRGHDSGAIVKGDGCTTVRTAEECLADGACQWCRNKWSPQAGSDGVCVANDDPGQLPPWGYECKSGGDPSGGGGDDPPGGGGDDPSGGGDSPWKPPSGGSGGDAPPSGGGGDPSGGDSPWGPPS